MLLVLPILLLLLLLLLLIVVFLNYVVLVVLVALDVFLVSIVLFQEIAIGYILPLLSHVCIFLNWFLTSLVNVGAIQLFQRGCCLFPEIGLSQNKSFYGPTLLLMEIALLFERPCY